MPYLISLPHRLVTVAMMVKSRPFFCGQTSTFVPMLSHLSRWVVIMHVYCTLDRAYQPGPARVVQESRLRVHSSIADLLGENKSKSHHHSNSFTCSLPHDLVLGCLQFGSARPIFATSFNPLQYGPCSFTRPRRGVGSSVLATRPML